MIVKETARTKIVEFSSINELVKHNREGNVQSDFLLVRASERENKDNWYGTASYAEAEGLLLHGWDYMAKELKSKIDVNMRLTGHTQRPAYSVAGYQACVPRYLMGIPDSMIYSKRVPKKEKVITINKSVSYSSRVEQRRIVEESVKVLNVTNELESKGLRVKLNIVWKVKDRRKTYSYVIKVNVKQPSQRLNIKQIAFPLVHPSMLRRIFLRTMEVESWCNMKGFCSGYGCPDNTTENITKGEYYIPAIVPEEEINDIQKYQV